MEGIMNPKKIFVVKMALLAAAFVISVAPAFAPPTPIHVISPNGGELWEVGSVHNITWTGGSGRISISYSTDSGQDWIHVGDTYGGNSYPWTIPCAPSSHCRVKVAEGFGYVDESDADFTIYGCGITVTSPNGGENWGVGSTHYIMWTTQNFTDSVEIAYSTNSGSKWILIDTVPYPGVLESIYQWIVPNTPSANCRVRVRDYKDGIPSDSSDNDFVISKITVLSPNGGEIWCGDSCYNILWNSNFFTDNVELMYSTNSGADWFTIVSSAQNDGSFQWCIPTNITSGNCRVKVCDHYDGDPADISDNNFSIIEAESIAVKYPNGREDLCADTSYNIKWNSYCFSGNVKIDYSTDGGSSWVLIVAGTPNDGNYDWTVPTTPSTQCRVRVSDAADGDPYDISDNDFTIHSPSFSIISPNSDSCWRIGSQQDIRWISSCHSGNVRIEYSTNEGTGWKIIDSSTVNDGIYTWTIPAETSCTVRVKVSDPISGVPSDISDAFSIGPAIRLTSPNGGEYWQGGSTHDITWSYFCCQAPIKIQYSTDGGGHWQTIINCTENDGVYSWDALNTTIYLSHCRIRICDCVKGQPCDISDNDFTIYPPPHPPPSCPYLFVWDGSDFVEDNTILTASEDAPQGKVVTDFYKIQKPLVAKEGKYHLQIKELEQEKSFIDHVELITIDHPESFRIGVTPDGKIFEMEESISPISAVDNKGVDQLDKVREADGNVYRCQEAGSLTLTYSLPQRHSAVIVVGGMASVLKQSPFCDTYPYALRSSPKDNKTLKGIRVEVQNEYGSWVELAVAPARKTLTENFWMLDSPNLDLGEQFKVRLSWNHEYSADELKYFFVSKSQPKITSVSLVSANHSTKGSVEGLLKDSDNQYVTLTPGETIDLSFSAEEPLSDGMTRDFVLKTVGYYIINYEEQFKFSTNEVALFNNFPNPFNPTTQISFSLPKTEKVTLGIYNLLGQRVITLLDKEMQAGSHTILWDGKNDRGEEVGSGVYFYRITIDKFSQTKKMLLLR
jgi:hypothetical protein